MNEQNPTPNFLDIPDNLCDPEFAQIHIIPVPFDLTSTYRKGSDKGPDAIIHASAQLEWHDIATNSEVHRFGIHTQNPIDCNNVSPEALSEQVQSRVRDVLEAGKIPVLLGGEHSVSIGAFEAAAEYSSQLTILQLDAHGDTRDSYQGSTHNHACVMARARELAPITQVGIRAIDAEELVYMDQDRVFFGHEIETHVFNRDDSWMDRVVDQLNPQVYLTIDLDAFDPSIIPSTGTPEPGGMDWRTMNELIRRVARSREIIGFDIVELCPNPNHHASDFIAAKLVLRVLAEIFSSRRIAES
ncbi:MAG: agmatinase [Phycisphaerales bacterium]|nr:agmatinase [Phycisphaerales bacterium]